MGKVRWTGWRMAIATVLVISGVQGAQADVASDKPAALLIYPKIQVDTSLGISTTVRLTNTSAAPIDVMCFYVNANSHCSGTGAYCSPTVPCAGTGAGQCTPGWVETDFRIRLTSFQPIYWLAKNGLGYGTPILPGGLPIQYGVCIGNMSITCGADADCQAFNAGFCTPSNAGTRIPPVSEDPFIGELKCLAIDAATGTPVVRNDLKGEAIIETQVPNYDVASYNAIGILAIGTPFSLVAGGPTYHLGPGSTGDYNACPTVLILNHFFQNAPDPVVDATTTIGTRLTIVPCSEDLLRQVGGTVVVQYLVFNEFEQRFSTSRTVSCFQDIELCNIDTPTCDRSIFSFQVAGTYAGQTRLSAVSLSAPTLSGKILAVATEHHDLRNSAVPPVLTARHTASFNVHMAGASETADTLTLP